MLLPGRNKVLDWIEQGGGLDLAHGPCVCHLRLNDTKCVTYFDGRHNAYGKNNQIAQLTDAERCVGRVSP